MNKIAVLGPENTYTDIATKVFLEKMSMDMSLEHYPTITKTFNSIGNDCVFGVIPIENTLDGYVQVSLDLLATSDLAILYEVVLPIDFTFVSNSDSIEDLEQLYVQFKTQNQCLDFLETLENVEIVTTPSNGTSNEVIRQGDPKIGAIIPKHMLKDSDEFAYRKDHVADSMRNETRFLVLGKKDDEEKCNCGSWRTSLLIKYNEDDKPGLLGEILMVFANHGINMISIMSRPNKSMMGHYIFFIDIEGCYKRDETVQNAVEKILKAYDIKVLGSYCRVN